VASVGAEAGPDHFGAWAGLVGTFGDREHNDDKYENDSEDSTAGRPRLPTDH